MAHRAASCRCSATEMDPLAAAIEPLVPGLRRYARSWLRDQAMADDLVQDCLERAVGRWRQRRGTEVRPGSMQSCIICWSIISGSMSGEVRRFRSTSWTTLRSVARPIRTQACTTETCCAHLMRCPRSSGRCCSSFPSKVCHMGKSLPSSVCRWER